MENSATRFVLYVLLLSICNSLSAQEIQFSKRPTEPHDVTEQVIEFDLEAERIIRQQNQIVDKSKHVIRRNVARTVTILGVANGKPNHARITFGRTRTIIEAEPAANTEITQPVEGNTYYAMLKEAELIVTDDQGREPTEEELEIVRSALQTLGKPNPIAEFLHGKRFRVGQQINVPKEVARELLGQSGGLAEADVLTLKLVAVKQVGREMSGVFEASLRSDSRELGGSSLLMRGQLVIETSSCRTQAMSLSGPIATSEIRGPAQGRFIVSTNGTLKVAIRATHSQERIASR